MEMVNEVKIIFAELTHKIQKFAPPGINETLYHSIIFGLLLSNNTTILPNHHNHLSTK